jgi:predicted nucleic acid-binding Zn ribbon protein
MNADDTLGKIAGMQSIQQSSVRVLRNLLAAQPTSPAKIAFAWQIVAGQPLARHGEPRWSDDGTLRIRPTNATWGRELRAGREVLLERLHELLGRDVITRLVIERDDYARPTR